MLSLMQNLPSKQQVEKALCEKSFYQFIKFCWPVVDSTPFDTKAWHIKLLADYFQALHEGKLFKHNLIINIPPRFGKSRVASLFPCWVWTSSQSKKFIFASYGKDLAEDSSKLARKVITSDWYQSMWNISVNFGENRQDFIANQHNGFIYSVGTGGAVTGKGGDYLIADDILKANDSSSDAERIKVNEWYEDTFSNRFNNIKTVKKIVIGQRLNNLDITGYLLDKQKNQWETVILPLEYEGKRYDSSIGLNDPRTAIGESLWPSRFGEKEIAELKDSMSELGAACQLQQRPTAKLGGYFKRDWFANRVENSDVIARYISIDSASVDSKTADYSAIVVTEITSEYKIFIRDVIRGKWQFPELIDVVTKTIKQYKWKLWGVIIENKSSGIQLIQTLTQSSEDWIAALITPYTPKESKEQRAVTPSFICEKGYVIFPPHTEQYPFLVEFEKEFFDFPNNAHDDMVDAFDMVCLYLAPQIIDAMREQKG